MMELSNIFYRFSYKKVLALSFLAIVSGIIFAGILMPKIIRQVLRMQLRVTPGTQTRAMFEKVPFPLHYRVYVLNITNPEEVLEGAKPKLQEIGPYYFEEYKDKIDVVDDKEEDTMEYDYRNTYIYMPEKNGPGLTGDEIVTIAHPLILSMAMSFHIERAELIPFITAAINGVLHNPTDFFFRGRLWDLLFDGIVLDCSSDKFEVTAACSEFGSGDYPEIRPINETAYSFSLFGNSNGSSIGRFKVLRGKKNIKDLGRVLEYNGLSELDAWYEDHCNQVTGTDGTIFPPLGVKEDGFTIFVPQMCRAMRAEYQLSTKVNGVKTNRFTVSFDVMRYGNPNCYCREGENCPPKGMLDLFPCSGNPVALSLPHFLDVDPEVLEKVEGLSPDREKHEFHLDIYQYAGVPISGKVRAQINFEVAPIEDISYMQNVQSMFLPLLWFEDAVVLDKKLVNMLKYQLILGLKLQKLLKYGGILVGFLGLVFGSIACFMQLDAEQQNVRPISVHSETMLTKPTVQSIEVTSNE